MSPGNADQSLEERLEREARFHDEKYGKGDELYPKHRGTITYAPNFAYALCTKRVKDEELPGLDLSQVRVAGCGAEPACSNSSNYTSGEEFSS